MTTSLVRQNIISNRKPTYANLVGKKSFVDDRIWVNGASTESIIEHDPASTNIGNCYVQYTRTSLDYPRKADATKRAKMTFFK